VARGDSGAVRDCLARYGGLVFSLARKFLGNSTDAEDATQDIFVELWRTAGRYDPAQSAETTFITMIARRRLIDGRRRAQRRPTPQALPDGLPGRDSGNGGSAETMDDANRARRALDELRDEQRGVILLSIDHGLTHDEIATRTGLPIGTVKTHIRRGLLKVREILDVTGMKGGVK